MERQYRNVFVEIGIEPGQVEKRLVEIRDAFFYEYKKIGRAHV